MKKEIWQNFTSGFIRENPIFVLYLGICSTLAVSVNLTNALGMGVSFTIVLVLSNLIISCLRKLIPMEIRIPVYIVIIATLVKSIDLYIQAYAPDISNALGVFIQLIVVNCIILGRAEAYASKHNPIESVIDGLGMGIGYTLGITAMAIIRQILATGVLSLNNPFSGLELFSLQLIPTEYTISLFSQSTGAFITFALLAAGAAALNGRAKKEVK